jgi:ubiquinone/menaquinone biosynthesis C-methylase UbiE
MGQNDFADISNPWLSIPASDYEGHMNLDTVRQLHVLSQIFENVMKDIPSIKLAVPGCGTGTGFEHIDPKVTESVLGIDINPEYLSIVRKRYGPKLPMLELICSDLNAFSCPDKSFDLIYAALIFEYMDFEKLLKRVSNWLMMNGTLVAVLQMPSPESKMISETPYSSLRAIEPIMHLVNPQAFNETAEKCGLRKFKEVEIPLKLGKKFLVSYYKKVQDNITYC